MTKSAVHGNYLVLGGLVRKQNTKPYGICLLYTVAQRAFSEIASLKNVVKPVFLKLKSCSVVSSLFQVHLKGKHGVPHTRYEKKGKLSDK